MERSRPYKVLGGRRDHLPSDNNSIVEKPRPYNYFAHQLQKMAASEINRKETLTTAACGHAATQSSSGNEKKGYLHSPVDVTTTGTPKRRRKEDGDGSRIRFSPEKNKKEALDNDDTCTDTDARNNTHANSPDEDDHSQLAGTFILQPMDQQYRVNDNLSYSDSESSVVRNLNQELMWETLKEDEEEEEDAPFDCRFHTGTSGKVVLEGSPATGMTLLTHQHASLPPPAKEPPSPDTRSSSKTSSMDQDEQTVEDSTSSSCSSSYSSSTSFSNTSNRSSSSPMQSAPRTLEFVGRQISECSSVTMELDSEGSTSSAGSYSSDYDSESYDASINSLDTGVMSKREGSNYLSFKRNQGSRATDSSTLSDRQCQPADSLSFWMWSLGETDNQFDSPTQQLQPKPSPLNNPRTRSSKKRKGQQSNQQQQQRQASGGGSFMFPMFPTDPFKSAESHQRSNQQTASTDSPLFLDVMADELKQLAIIAGKSSEDLVSSIFTQLCEDSRESS
ncbi:expressed unknown protein [Seminavis robusta]|uniref:Uncharacterized protein n=1 Tax=Seminavis robusta TaxID=568900 RepID=A0A9N8HFL6_9STRA|nr:expressed unknown protein [Seminavis robusta]|eukprot:Sro440_g143550.1 n/a (504) ;mRNA; f:48072-49583